MSNEEMMKLYCRYCSGNIHSSYWWLYKRAFAGAILSRR
jgi:hypothetical protein